MSDFRIAVRNLVKQPVLSLLVVGMLTLGIAGTTAIFSLFNGLFLKPLPVDEPDRLVDIDEAAPKWNLEFVSVAPPDFYAWEKDNTTFDSMAAYDEMSANITGQGAAQRVEVLLATHHIFKVLRIKPALGRTFTAEEDRKNGARVAMVSHGLWQRMFGGRPDVLGKVLRGNGREYTVIGVLPREAVLPGRGEIWGPLQTDPNDSGGWWLNAIGRLKPGVTIEQARQDLLRVHKARIPTRNVNEITSPKVTGLRDRAYGNVRTAMTVVLGSVGVVLLIACVNIAGLMLARGNARGREMGIRAALGASRWRIARQLLGESALLAAIGGLLGVALGSVATRALVSMMPENRLPAWVTFTTDWRFLAFSAALTCASAMVFALWPALRSSRVDLRESLQETTTRASSSRGGRWSLNALVTAEVALAVVLLVAAGLLVRAFAKLQAVDPGFRAENVLTYRVSLPQAIYSKPEQQVAFYKNLIEKTRAIPGVIAAGGCSAPPLGGHWGMFYEVENAPSKPLTREEQDPVVLTRVASPGYFEAIGLRLVNGRWFNDHDGTADGPKSVIVNESFARRFWQGADPVGKRLRARGNNPWVTVVGVAADIKHYGLEERMRPGVYFPHAQLARDMAIVIRSSVDPISLTSAARETLRQLDADLPMFQVRTMTDRMNESIWLRRTYSWLLGVFSAIALLLAAGGLYGVVSYSVSRRTHEIGIRMALGARQDQVLGQVLRQGLALAAAGLALGLGAAFLSARLLDTMLFGVSPRDPVIYGAVAAGLLAIAVLANLAPARRAASVDPMAALRVE